MSVYGHDDYSPLVAKFPMSWPPRGCNWCGSAEMIWAYPLGHVNFPRVNPADGIEMEIPHHPQQWFACKRCKGHIDTDRMSELADILEKPQGYWDRLTLARLRRGEVVSPGMPWDKYSPKVTG